MPSAERKPKILYIITKSNWGGAQRYVYDLATSMEEEGFDVSVALGGTGELHATPGKLAEKLREHSITVHVIEHFTRDIFLLQEVRALIELTRLCAKERPDIVHLNSSKAGLLGSLAARIAGVPVIVFTAHGWPWREVHRSFLWRAIAWLGSWITLLLCHQVITVSEFDRIESDTLPFASGKVMTIYNGHEAAPLETRGYARSTLLPHARMVDPFWIGTIGELHQNKGIDIALEAIENLFKGGHGVTYVVIGEGDERHSLEEQIRNTGLERSVHLVGFKPNASTLLAAFDLFLLPDRKAGFPYVLLEAGSTGLPVIASAVGGIPEIITDGVNGILTEPEDPRALTERIEALMQDENARSQYARALKATVEHQFGKKRMVEETTALYRARLSLRA